jgi:predicted RNA-binding Zn-ribbon protein involved in translation (DUF1610 family)
MSLSTDLTKNSQRVIGGSVDPSRGDPAKPIEPETDVVDVSCGACGGRQKASGRALSFTCDTCGEIWRVLKCRTCRKASLVVDGTTACPRCGHDHQARDRALEPAAPAWLTEPVPLSIWLGSVKYLGGHGAHTDAVNAGGLLLDRRGLHVRAFKELFTIDWDTVRGVDIEGPQDISERLTYTKLLSLGASTWAMQIAYLTVRTTDGDAIFEVDGLGPPELHARLSRVIQGLKQSERLHKPVDIERPVAPPAPSAPPAPAPAPSTASRVAPVPPASPASAAPHPYTTDWVEESADTAADLPATTPLAIDVAGADTPIEVLVIDALWKLGQLREKNLLTEIEAASLRARLIARIPELSDPAVQIDLTGGGPLLQV